MDWGSGVCGTDAQHRSHSGFWCVDAANPCDFPHADACSLCVGAQLVSWYLSCPRGTDCSLRRCWALQKDSKKRNRSCYTAGGRVAGLGSRTRDGEMGRNRAGRKPLWGENHKITELWCVLQRKSSCWHLEGLYLPCWCPRGTELFWVGVCVELLLCTTGLRVRTRR